MAEQKETYIIGTDKNGEPVLLEEGDMCLRVTAFKDGKIVESIYAFGLDKLGTEGFAENLEQLVKSGVELLDKP